MADSSVKMTPMDDREMALLSGSGYTGTMLVTSGDPGCILTPFIIQLRWTGGDEGPAFVHHSNGVSANQRAYKSLTNQRLSV